VAEAESITVGEEEIKAEEEKMMAQLQGQEVDPDRLRQVVTDNLITEKTYAWLAEHSTVELVPEGTLSEGSEGEEEDAEAEEAVAVETEVVTDETP
jgi:trigger factor